MSVPNEAAIVAALAEAGPRSTSWLCMKFDVRGDQGFWELRAVLDKLAAEKVIKLDTQGFWSVVAKVPAKNPEPASA